MSYDHKQYYQSNFTEHRLVLVHIFPLSGNFQPTIVDTNLYLSVNQFQKKKKQHNQSNIGLKTKSSSQKKKTKIFNFRRDRTRKGVLSPSHGGGELGRGATARQSATMEAKEKFKRGIRKVVGDPAPPTTVTAEQGGQRRAAAAEMEAPPPFPTEIPNGPRCSQTPREVGSDVRRHLEFS